ncbi:MAG: hypothetical protein EZS28_046617, partial [Streblomastix strix]
TSTKYLVCKARHGLATLRCLMECRYRNFLVLSSLCVHAVASRETLTTTELELRANCGYSTLFRQDYVGVLQPESAKAFFVQGRVWGLFEPGRQVCLSSAGPGWQQSADAQNMYKMLHTQALKPRDGFLLIQRTEKLPLFNWEPGEEDALRQIISLAPPIRLPEDVVSVISRKRSLQVKAQDYSISMFGQKVFNQVWLGITVLNCGQLEDRVELRTLKGMEIYAEIERMREAALKSQSARVSTEQGRLRLQSIQDNIKNSSTQLN